MNILQPHDVSCFKHAVGSLIKDEQEEQINSNTKNSFAVPSNAGSQISNFEGTFFTIKTQPHASGRFSRKMQNAQGWDSFKCWRNTLKMVINNAKKTLNITFLFPFKWFKTQGRVIHYNIYNE